METIAKILSVGIGGAFGAAARYLLNISPLNNVFANFPFPTFIINILGSFLIGFFLILLTDKINVGDNFRLAVMVGFLGAFTTFSTFEMELFGLVKDRSFVGAFVYLFFSVVVGFIGVIAGIWLARKF